MKLFKIVALLLALGTVAPASAKLIHIIHTNDLHSMFQGTRNGLGGYARLKTVVDQLRKDSESKNIKTLYLDGGDFGEGSSFYFSNNGVDSLRALDILGVDVTVIGNHDYILGGHELSNQIRDAKLKAKIISGNIVGKRLLGLHKQVPDHVDIDLDGMKMRIMGLTTSEIHYQYPFRPLGWVGNSNKAGIRMAEKAQREGVDFLIALTHIGLERDIKLVQNTFSVDLVIGGHSHTFLPRPVMTKNMLDRLVPVVQVGAHSMHVGSIMIDVQPNGKSTLVDYKTFDITKSIPEELTMKALVDRAVVNRENYFDRKWDEVIGFAEIPLTGYYNGLQVNSRSCWSRHLARLTRQAADADVGVQFDDFQGEKIEPGPITFGDIIDNYPHFRKWHDKGWKIKRAWVQGFLLKKILKVIGKSDFSSFLTFDGLESNHLAGQVQFDVITHPVDSAMMNGEPIQNLKYYRIALPSEVPHALMKIFNIFGYLIFNNLRTVKNTDYWPLLENYIKENSPLRCIEDPQN